MLITPGGIPASSRSSIVRCAASCWVGEGFQTTVLPISAGAVGQVAGDRGEVERRDRVDEPLERAVVGAVPDALAVGDRLLGEDLPRVVHVEAPEVDQLARRVDLGLPDRLRLAEHRRRVEPGTPGTGQQVGGLEDDAGAVVEGHRPPAGSGVARGADRGLRVAPASSSSARRGRWRARAAGRRGSRHHRPSPSARRSWRSGRAGPPRGGRARPRPRRARRCLARSRGWAR